MANDNGTYQNDRPPRADEIRLLEKMHKEQFYLIVQANNFILNALKHKDKFTPDQNVKFAKYIDDVKRLVNKWKARNFELQKAGAPPYSVPEFFRYATQEKLNQMVDGMDASKGGLGFIPLIIWAVIVIAGLVTAGYIVNQLNDTAGEKAELLQKTADIAKQLNLTTDQAKVLIEGSQASLTSSGSGIFDFVFSLKGLATAAILYGGYKYSQKNK